jgi:SPX domain protein involved in polyphosphate accumulation
MTAGGKVLMYYSITYARTRYRNLDDSYTVTKNFAEAWLSQLEQRVEFHETTISEALALNQFVFVNQEGFRKIIKKHDKNFPESRYFFLIVLCGCALNS